MPIGWPLIDESISFPANIGTAAPFPYWVSVVGRSIDRNMIKQGRQYELQIVQTGEYTPTLDNRDAALSPVNTAGPWSANFQPYCAYRKRAMWPPSPNGLYQFQATGGSVPSGFSAGAQFSSIPNLQILSSVGTTSVQTSPNPFRPGYSNVFSVPVAPTLAAGNGLLVWQGLTLYPDQPHSWQVWVCLTSGTVSLPVCAALAWFDATGAQIGTTTTGSVYTIPAGSTAWVNVQLANQVPPSNAAGVLVAVNNAATVASSVTLACAAAQFEQSSTCSAFSQPGVWY